MINYSFNDLEHDGGISLTEDEHIPHSSFENTDGKDIEEFRKEICMEDDIAKRKLDAIQKLLDYMCKS